MSARRALFARCCAAGAAVLTALVAPARAETPLELAVKATYLYKLAPFVGWPAQAFAAANSPLTICIQGNDPFGPLLDRAVSGQAVGTHPVAVRRLARVDGEAGCHVAYLAGGAQQSPAQALQALDGAPALTVTDEARGPARGVVHLVLDAGKVRFAVNEAQAQAGGLTVSSKLLALAVAVRR